MRLATLVVAGTALAGLACTMHRQDAMLRCGSGYEYTVQNKSARNLEVRMATSTDKSSKLIATIGGGESITVPTPSDQYYVFAKDLPGQPQLVTEFDRNVLITSVCPSSK